jgi:hypothetical protein
MPAVTRYFADRIKWYVNDLTEMRSIPVPYINDTWEAVHSAYKTKLPN